MQNSSLDGPSNLIAKVGGIPFFVTSLDDSVRWILKSTQPGYKPQNVRLANAYCVALADKDNSYESLLKEQGVNLPDGTPVTWFMNTPRRLKEQNRDGVKAGRVRGPSLFNETLRQSASTTTRHFFLGATSDTLTMLQQKILTDFPSTAVAGMYSPPFAEISESYINDCAEQISKCDANLIWVGLGTPKQDFVGQALTEKLGITSINVGAAFDFLAGTVKEAPIFIQNSGFEWLYRFFSEPRRLWKRYFFGNIRFFIAAIKK